MTFSEKVNKMIDIIKNARLQLIAKGETVTYDDDIPQIIEDMETGGGADSAILKAIIEGESAYDLVIPEGVTSIRSSFAVNGHFLKSVTIANSVITIGGECFSNCTNILSVNIGTGLTAISSRAFYSNDLRNVRIPGNVKRIYNQAFVGNNHLTDVYLANGVESIDGYAFAALNSLTTVFLPNTLTSVERYVFYADNSMEFVTLEPGFNCDKLYLSYSDQYSAATIVSWLNALADRTGQTAYTLTIGSTNLAKLTAEQIAIATNKNWNLA